MMRDRKYWIVVASREHVQRGITGGFMQACHGKQAPLKRMLKGDGIIYYSGKERMGENEPCQKFTAIGEISGDEVYPFQMSPDFCPFRRDVRFYEARDVSILPMIHDLNFIVNKKSWGYPFRFGILEIGRDDFEFISSLMLNSVHD